MPWCFSRYSSPCSERSLSFSFSGLAPLFSNPGGYEIGLTPVGSRVGIRAGTSAGTSGARTGGDSGSSVLVNDRINSGFGKGAGASVGNIVLLAILRR